MLNRMSKMHLIKNKSIECLPYYIDDINRWMGDFLIWPTPDRVHLGLLVPHTAVVHFCRMALS